VCLRAATGILSAWSSAIDEVEGGALCFWTASAAWAASLRSPCTSSSSRNSLDSGSNSGYLVRKIFDRSACGISSVISSCGNTSLIDLPLPISSPSSSLPSPPLPASSHSASSNPKSASVMPCSCFCCSRRASASSSTASASVSMTSAS